MTDQPEFHIHQCEILNPPVALVVDYDHVVCSTRFQLEDVCCSLLLFEAWSVLVYIVLLYLKYYAILTDNTEDTCGYSGRAEGEAFENHCVVSALERRWSRGSFQQCFFLVGSL